MGLIGKGNDKEIPEVEMFSVLFNTSVKSFSLCVQFPLKQDGPEIRRLPGKR